MGMGGGMDMGGGGMGRGSSGNTYGLSTGFLDSLGIEGEIHTRIFVSNLDFKVDDNKLREVFSIAGRVMRAEVFKDKENTAKGFGTVVFDHPVEAVQAISMFNGQPLYERMLRVRMDKKREEPVQRNLNRLPDGLGGIGMGLGSGGKPLDNVRENVPSGGGGGGGGESMNGGGNNSFQAALATIANMAGNMRGGM